MSPVVNGIEALQLEASGSKWVNSILDTIGVNSLRLGGLQ